MCNMRATMTRLYLCIIHDVFSLDFIFQRLELKLKKEHLVLTCKYFMKPLFFNYFVLYQKQRASNLWFGIKKKKL